MSATSHIHLLGLGAIGSFLAISLRRTNPTLPIHLHLRSPARVGSFNVLHGRLILRPPADDPIRTASNFIPHDVNTYASAPTNPPITNLIVTTKCHSTIAALRPLVPVLSSNSTVLFLQNGLGVEEEASALWPEGVGRPRFLSGVVTHGVTVNGRNEIALASLDGGITIGADKPAVVVNALKNCTKLRVRVVSEREIRLAKLEKLVVNAGINPVTVVHDCPNGELLHRCESMMQAVAGEASRVVVRMLKGGISDKELERRFAPDRLYQRMREVADGTAENISSMLQDVRKKQRTEIAYINGYLVRKGEELGISTPINRELVERVERKLPKHLK